MMLPINETLKQSWALVKGSKRALWKPLIIMALINIALFVLFLFVTVLFYNNNPVNALINPPPLFRMIHDLILPLIISIFIAPILTGTLIIALKRCRGESIKKNSAFRFRNYWLQTAAALTLFLVINILVEMICSRLAVTVASHRLLFWAVNIGGSVINILLYSFLFFSLIIIKEQNKKALGALIASAKLVASHWLSTTALYIITFAVIMASLLPLFISTFMNNLWLELFGALVTIAILIWTLPYCVLIIAMAYQRLTQHDSTKNHSQDAELLASN